MGSRSVGAWVRESLQGYLRGDSRFPRGFEVVASDHELLPLGDDLAYTYFLNSEGVIFWQDALEPEAGISQVDDERERHRIIRAYSREFPELLALLPARPRDRPPCAQCSGSGFMNLRTTTGIDHQVPCSVCGGTGWTRAAV
jgi:hypothetical protein